MKKFLMRSFFLSLLLVVLLSLTAVAADDLPLGSLYYTGTTRLNMRSGPSASYSLVTQIPSDSVFNAIRLEGNWYYASYSPPGSDEIFWGYVSAPYVTLTPHSWVISYETDSGPYDCSVGGFKVSTCSICGYEHREEVSGHIIERRIGVSSNCEADTTNYSFCIICDWEETVVVPARGHDLITYYKGPDGGEFSCLSGGYKISYCKNPTCRYSTEEIIPPGHSFSEVVRIDPTYHSTGSITNQCDLCGHREYITIPVLVDDGMSEDVYSLGSAFMSGVWKLFGVYVPGFGFTFGGLSLGILTVSLSLSVIYMIFGFGRRGGAVSSRSGSTNKAKISKERENDDH